MENPSVTTIYRPACGDKPCKECPFRKKAAQGWLGEAAPEDFIRELFWHENPMPCHPTIDYSDPEWQEKWLHQSIGKICAGSLILMANACKKPRDPAYPKLPSDRATVFATPQDFLKYHNAAAVKSWAPDFVERSKLKKKKP